MEQVQAADERRKKQGVDGIAETFGELPKKFLTDGGNNHGHVMQAMEERSVGFYAPGPGSPRQHSAT